MSKQIDLEMLKSLKETVELQKEYITNQDRMINLKEIRIMGLLEYIEFLENKLNFYIER